MSLPPLPGSLAVFTPTRDQHVKLNWIVREYGELCRKMALEEAVKACETIEREHLDTYKHKPGTNAYDPHLNLHGEREMTYPPLPAPTIIDGRRLYTAGDMRAYGDACVKVNDPDSCDWIPPTTRRDKPSYSAAVDDLFQKMGMKK